MARRLAFVYGIAAYIVFLLTFAYSLGWVGDLLTPTSVDRGDTSGLWAAVAIDVALLLAFALQHSVMARPAFKRLWTRVVPPAIERSTYVLIASLVLALLLWQWRPIPGTVWDVSGTDAAPVLWTAFGIGWMIVLSSTFMIDHLDFFGLRQVRLFLADRPYRHPDFATLGLYRWVRHPLMLGFLIAFWAAPVMTLGHLLFAVATTGYILVAVPIEERDLLRYHGRAYEAYRERVFAFLPLRKAEEQRHEEPAR